MIKLKKILNSIINEGFDFYAKNSNEDFSIDIFTWGAILSVIHKANNVFNLNLPHFEMWATNDGAGLQTSKECNELADALESLIGDRPYNQQIKNPSKQAPTLDDQTDIGTIHEFIKFLRKCNGFEIW